MKKVVANDEARRYLESALTSGLSENACLCFYVVYAVYGPLRRARGSHDRVRPAALFLTSCFAPDETAWTSNRLYQHEIARNGASPPLPVPCFLIANDTSASFSSHMPLPHQNQHHHHRSQSKSPNPDSSSCVQPSSHPIYPIPPPHSPASASYPSLTAASAQHQRPPPRALVSLFSPGLPVHV